MKLQDNIHYYIGCEVIVDGKERARLIGGSFVPNSCNQIYYDLQTEEMKAEDIDFSMPYNDDADDPEPRIKPILNRLSNLPEKEGIEMFGNDRYWDIVCMEGKWDSFSSKELHILTKQGYDLFGLIDAGLAIDSKTLK